MNGEFIAIPVVVMTLAYGVITVVRLLLEHIRRTKSEKLQAEVYSKMLDKLGSSQDILTWAQSDTSQNLFAVPPPERPAPYARILNAIQIGVVLTVVGLAVLGVKAQLTAAHDQEPAMVIGMLVTALGLGLLLSGGISWLLCRKFGLINGRPAIE
ncbi:MAG TPA: hypothetical protein VGK29_17300 [Paludibaculum sp.]|jgi:hypothetical protein